MPRNNTRDGAFNQHDIGDLRKFVERKGKVSAILDKSIGQVLNEADRLDVERRGFLQALADLVAAAAARGMSKTVLLECLKAAVEGMEHV